MDILVWFAIGLVVIFVMALIFSCHLPGGSELWRVSDPAEKTTPEVLNER